MVVVILGVADGAPRTCAVVAVDLDCFGGARDLHGRSDEGAFQSLDGGVTLQSAEEDVGGFGVRHREVDVRGL